MPLDIPHLPKTASLLNVSPPPTLYHYTVSAALLSIVTSGEMWAGLPEQMNDAEELRRAVRVLNVIAKERELDGRTRGDKGGTYLLDKWAAEQSERALADVRWLNDEPKSYLISLTSEGDSLSQWRSYCPGNDGYCLGLPAELLIPAVETGGALFAPCVYGEDDVSAIVQEIFEFHTAKWLEDAPEWTNATTAEGLERDTRAHTDSVVAAWKALMSEVRMIGHFVKNPSFKAEQEWRILLFDQDVSTDDLRFAAGKNGIRAFLPFAFIDTTSGPLDTSLRPSLRIGPNADLAGAKFSAIRLMERLVGPGNADVFSTSSSYR